MRALLRVIYNSSLARRLYRSGPGRFLYHLPGELARRLSGRARRLAPPMWKVYTGRGDFEHVGREFLGYFTTLGGLRTDDHVLDVGSGIGRMALPLTSYLGPAGRYTGIEIVRDGLRWCTSNITPRNPTFTFVHADIYNELYNPSGQFRPEEYRFPFDDGTFGFVFLTSVFTHMHPDAVRNYLREIARVLSVGRRCLFTCSLIDSTTRELIHKRRSTLDFRYKHGDYYSLSRKGDTRDVAFDVEWMLHHVSAAGLSLVPPVHFGRWSGREPALSVQDIVVVEKSVYSSGRST